MTVPEASVMLKVREVHLLNVVCDKGKSAVRRGRKRGRKATGLFKEAPGVSYRRNTDAIRKG